MWKFCLKKLLINSCIYFVVSDKYAHVKACDYTTLLNLSQSIWGQVHNFHSDNHFYLSWDPFFTLQLLDKHAYAKGLHWWLRRACWGKCLSFAANLICPIKQHSPNINYILFVVHIELFTPLASKEAGLNIYIGHRSDHSFRFCRKRIQHSLPQYIINIVKPNSAHLVQTLILIQWFWSLRSGDHCQNKLTVKWTETFMFVTYTRWSTAHLKTGN